MSPFAISKEGVETEKRLRAELSSKILEKI